ncbi:hypothetical protein QYZ88_016830 [Lachnospiraceae bacterium C1.1]
MILMDEPLSNLDAKLRGQMRVELIKLHKSLGTTFIYVTHDQVEAMSMADDIVLIDKGKKVQQAAPRELYNNPSCVYAAQFIGTPQMNIVKDILPGGLQMGFRPEKTFLHQIEEEHISMSGRIKTKEMLGAEIIYSIETKYGNLMSKTDIDIPEDEKLKIQIPLTNIYLFDENGDRVEMDQERKAIVIRAFDNAEA